MTEDMVNLRTFMEKTPDADLLREMIGIAAERLMELEVGAATSRQLHQSQGHDPLSHRRPRRDGQQCRRESRPADFPYKKNALFAGHCRIERNEGVGILCKWSSISADKSITVCFIHIFSTFYLFAGSRDKHLLHISDDLL